MKHLLTIVAAMLEQMDAAIGRVLAALDRTGRATAGGPVAKPRKPATNRAAMFKSKDTNHDGKLTLEEYLHNFPDEAEGRRRFLTFDTNKDGVLSEEEFVNMGRR